MTSMTADVLVVGAGPAGSAAAVWAARSGRDVVLIDAENFPRDKTCGDGLTPRAIAQLQLLGMGDWLRSRPRNRGIRMIGFGTQHDVAWNGPHLPDFGSAAPRTELDDALRQMAVESGARFHGGVRALGALCDARGRVEAVTVKGPDTTSEIRCRSLIVADGVRSRLGGSLGRVWHRDTVYGVAARAYVRSARHDEPWITSHLELRDEQGQAVAGYGWLFPLGNGEINLGVGSLATQKQHGKVNLHALLRQYSATQRAAFGLDEELRAEASAMLPMGGAVTKVSGPNWLLIGDAAACVNPLNGEGIDYGLETGRLATEVLAAEDLTTLWPGLLREQYGDTFSVARRMAALLTYDWFLPVFGPIGMRSGRVMSIAARVMGNLVTDEDRDLVARAWRLAGAASRRVDARPLWN